MNELEKRAKWHKKKQKGLSPFSGLSPIKNCIMPDSGSDASINTFNKGTGLTMIEDMKFNVGDRVEFFAPNFGQTWGNIKDIIEDNGVTTAVVKAANRRIYNVPVSQLEDEMNFGLFETYIMEDSDAGERDSWMNKIKEYNPNFRGLKSDGSKMDIPQLMAVYQSYKDSANKQPPMTAEESQPKQQDGGIVNDDGAYNIPGESDNVTEVAESTKDKIKQIENECFYKSGDYVGLTELYEDVEDRLDANQRNELRKLINTTSDPETIANYLAAVTAKKEDLHIAEYNQETLDEDYSDSHDDWGEPYDISSMERVIQQLTNNYTNKEGTLRTYYRAEKIAAVEELKKYYDVVEVSDGRYDTNDDISYVIAYSSPKIDEKLQEAYFDPENMIGDYAAYKIILDDNLMDSVSVYDRENKEDSYSEVLSKAYDVVNNFDGKDLQIVYSEGDDSDSFDETILTVDLTDPDDYDYFIHEYESWNNTGTSECLEEAYEPEIRDGYYRMDIKHVKDSDGFLTDYTWWYNPETEKHVFVFGDSDMYGPADSDVDWEAESEETAKEWWDDYTGPYEEEGFDESLNESYSDKDVKDFLDEIGGYTDYDGKVEELLDYFGMTKEQAESAIQDYVTSPDDDDEAELDEAVSDLSHPEQEFDSAATSINSSKLPAIYKMVKFNPGDVVIDFGGGRFDNAVEYIKDKGSTLVVYDPYNRSAEHNEQVLATLEENGGADAAVNSNVLNVIKEPEARRAVLENIKKLTKPGAPIYITVYEGRGDGVEGPTKSGYQLNRRTEGYLDEVREVFPNATRKGKLIVATNSGGDKMKVTKLNENKQPLYIIKDSKGNQLSAPNPDDNELWDRVADFEARGRRGLCVVAYTGKDVDEGVSEDTKELLSESHDDTVEFVMQIEDMIREVTPNIIGKAFGKSYSFDLEGEGSAEEAMDSFREAVHELAMAIYSMVVARREGYDESLNEDVNDTAYTYSVSDIIAAMTDNCSEEQIDKELKLFDSINQKLGVDDAVFIIDDEGRFNPDYLDFDMIDDLDGNVYTVKGIKFYVEHNDNGRDYMYFRSDDDAKSYVDLVNKFYDEDMDEGIIKDTIDKVKEDPGVIGQSIGKGLEIGGKLIGSLKDLHS